MEKRIEGNDVVIDNVPIFDEHDEFTSEKLAEIVANCNRRIADTGDAVPLVIGHTDDNTPETAKPEIVGYATKFSLGKIGRLNPRAAVVATFRIPRDKWELVKKYPRRSVELWLNDLVIDPIALLGPTTPKRDLGLMFGKNEADGPRYSHVTQTEEAMDQEQLQAIIDAVRAIPELAFVRDLMDKQQADVAQNAAAETEDGATEGEQMDAEKAPTDDDTSDETPDRLKAQRDQERRRYARLDSEYKALASKVADMEGKARHAERKADLLNLEGQGIVFDMAEELESVKDLSPARYARHLDTMAKRYSRAPVGVHVDVATVPVEGGKPTDNVNPREVWLKAAAAAEAKYQK